MDFDFNLILQLPKPKNDQEKYILSSDMKQITGGPDSVQIRNDGDEKHLKLAIVRGMKRVDNRLVKDGERIADAKSVKLRASKANGSPVVIEIDMKNGDRVSADLVPAIKIGNTPSLYFAPHKKIRSCLENPVGCHRWPSPDSKLHRCLKENIYLTPGKYKDAYHEEGKKDHMFDFSMAPGCRLFVQNLNQKTTNGELTCDKELFKIMKALAKLDWGNGNSVPKIPSYLILTAYCYERERKNKDELWVKSKAKDRLQGMIGTLIKALESKDLTPYIQPIYEIETGRPRNMLKFTHIAKKCSPEKLRKCINRMKPYHEDVVGGMIKLMEKKKPVVP